jgi:predicted alpha/beta-fold hydrolase
MSRVAAFAPHRLVANPHLQSVLASSKLRLIHHRGAGGFGIVRQARRQIVDCGEGSRLAALYTPPRTAAPGRPDLAVLIHGWEGCADSTYMVSTGEILHRAGYAVVRLNLRDHGGTHALNEGIFHANRIEEVIGAINAIARAISHRRLCLVGFSLGGNFALRVGLRAPLAKLSLSRIVAVNPALDPPSTVDAIDRHLLYRRVFLSRWRRSLLRKQEIFPHLYDFRRVRRLGTVHALSQHVIPRYTPFATVDDYLAGYRLDGERLARMEVSTTIVTAADDPIISVDHFRALPPIATISVDLQTHGGHCGYILGPTLGSWLESRILAILAS